VAPYYVIADTNIWVAERLLQSSIGNAFLYAVTVAKSSILLPEVVELEVARVLPEMAEQAVGNIRRDVTLLRQLSGQHDVTVLAPSASRIEDGIWRRWKELSGLLIRVPFTFDQARSALQRVIRKAPPSGHNNEQFRDCCIWEAALSMTADRVVHLVSADNAFYESRDKTAGLAGPLRAELKTARNEIHIHASLRDFLAAMGSGVAIDETIIGDAITKAVMGEARDFAAKPSVYGFDVAWELVKAHRPKIRCYATPKPSLVALSFSVPFDLQRTSVEGETETRKKATLTANGVCAYDPSTKDLSEIEIREWTLTTPSGGWVQMVPDREVNRQYGAGGFRLIE
jgi:hypothetical protein